jgi:hypothetical protein
MVELCACSFINLRGTELIFIDLPIDPKLLFLCSPFSNYPKYLNSGEDAIFALAVKMMIYDSSILRVSLSPEREKPARGGRSAPELRQSIFGKFRPTVQVSLKAYCLKVVDAQGTMINYFSDTSTRNLSRVYLALLPYDISCTFLLRR